MRSSRCTRPTAGRLRCVSTSPTNGHRCAPSPCSKEAAPNYRSSAKSVTFTAPNARWTTRTTGGWPGRPAASSRSMRHFAHLGTADRRRLFTSQPVDLDSDTDPATLAVALGATLYLPGDRRHLADDLERMAGRGVVSAVVCLEDAIANHDAGGAPGT